MFAIAFFTTVILFSASLYVGSKIAETVRNHKSSTTESDFVISPNPYIGVILLISSLYLLLNKELHSNSLRASARKH